MNFLLNVARHSDSVCTYATRQAFLLVALCPSSRQIILMTEWVCRWKLFWIPTGDTFQKACLEEWQRIDDEQRRDPGEDNLQTSPCSTEYAKLSQSRSKDINFKQEQPWHHQILRGKQLENLTRQPGSS